MDKGNPFSGCNGHQRCEEYCSGPIEQFLYYNNTKQKNPKVEASAKDAKDKVSPCGSSKSHIFWHSLGARISELRM